MPPAKTAKCVCFRSCVGDTETELEGRFGVVGDGVGKMGFKGVMLVTAVLCSAVVSGVLEETGGEDLVALVVPGVKVSTLVEL
jgi:hypothetical protein